jgi:hypothetical protein
MRKKIEVLAEEQRLYDQLWYARHMTMEMPEHVPEDIVKQAEAKARQVEKEYTKEHLDGIQHDEYEVGVLHGKLMALRWMLGMNWDEDGILDS